jgi:hypothetical protein
MQLASKPFNSIFQDTHANTTSRTDLKGKVGLHAMLIPKRKNLSIIHKSGYRVQKKDVSLLLG